MSDIPASTQEPTDHGVDDPQELPGADPAQDRDDDDPKDGPIGNKPGAPKVIDVDDPSAQQPTNSA